MYKTYKNSLDVEDKRIYDMVKALGNVRLNLLAEKLHLGRASLLYRLLRLAALDYIDIDLREKKVTVITLGSRSA
jgi:Mn-dependent DtxR family transcriptional regulator